MKRHLIHIPILLCSILSFSGCSIRQPSSDWVLVNDIHSQLNPTLVNRILHPRSIPELQEIIRHAKKEKRPISIMGGNHAMGGQQFGTDTILINMSEMKKILHFNIEEGLIEVEAGIQWSDLIHYLNEKQKGRSKQWTIIQKQSGADDFSIGGTLSVNGHGRGLNLKPMIDQIESFVLVDAEGHYRNCSRYSNTELFKLASGGYGLFGVIVTAKLRLTTRLAMERVVHIKSVRDLIPFFQKSVEEGFTYGDFQFSTDEHSDQFLNEGILSMYKPIITTSIPSQRMDLSEDEWTELHFLAHANRQKAYQKYSSHYLATSGQRYWSDELQRSIYLKNYHDKIDKTLESTGTEMITECYVPRSCLVVFMNEVRRDFIIHNVPFIYGTIRLIEEDNESFLAWAKQPYACIVFNLHVDHTPQGKENAARHFKRIIDRTISHDGSFFLTYHRWATREQVEACYPQFVDFLKLKKKYDPQERFQSTWYRHYKGLFSNSL